MSKTASRLIVAVENSEIWRMLSRVGASTHEVVRAATESQMIDELERSSPIAAVIVEPLVGRLSGLKALDLARDAQPQALRVVVSNFSEISLLIEGVHTGLVQRILGVPLMEAEVRALLAGAWSATGFNFPRASVSIPA